MTLEEVTSLIAQYATKEGIKSSYDTWQGRGAGGSQYDDYSASVNYSFVRHFKPQTVIEFGSRTGRCTHDILLALQRNNQPFVFKAYEIEDSLRTIAQNNIDEDFGQGVLTIGGDVTKADDLPDQIDYAFIDNSHDAQTTQWVFDVLLPKCKPGALIHIHDLRFRDDWVSDGGGFPDETKIVISQADKNGGPLTKLFWCWEHTFSSEGAWFIYNP